MPSYPRPSGIPRKIARWIWKGLIVPGRIKRHKPSWFWEWRRWRLSKPGTPPPVSPPTSLIMYDDVNVALIPSDAPAVAGYLGGSWPTYPKVVSGWPRAKHLAIAVSNAYNADCLDVEPGDATVAQAALWVKRQIDLRKNGGGYKNTTKPVVYTSASWGQGLINALEGSGLKYGQDFLWWSAHYNPAQGKHICSPKCGFGIKVTAHATQWTNTALGRSLDESIVSPGFFS